MNKRMDRNRLNIGAYHLRPYARTEAHVKDVADCGIDFVVCMDNDRPALDLFHKYGVGAIVSGIVPGWWGGDGSNAGKLADTNPMEKYEAACASFVDHPAIWGIDVGDEPSALDFPYYGKVIDYVNRAFSNQFAYLNLYPNYASVSGNNAQETVNQLGTATYAEHIRRYCECVPSDYLCYDFYLYSINVAKHYENLRVVADACRNTGRSMWIVLQVNSHRPDEWMSENNLRFQAYTSMAFGAENIIWACYTAGWWHNQVLDDQGNQTEQYGKLKRVNAQIRTIADEYMKYRRVSTHFVGYQGHPDMNCVQQESIESLSTGVFFDVKSDNGAPILVGEMVSRTNDGSAALMICAADDPYEKEPKEYQVTFRAPNRCIRALGGEGYKTVTDLGGVYAVTVRSNEGVLITAR
ncbi:MAG: hypothetical protein IKB28_01400 [Clostridia bacterium]|nr:hypothetical protein [Oscillospiraceae bacterium]MBR2445303.1 hypothetical protein [Clostridia bacterium]